MIVVKTLTLMLIGTVFMEIYAMCFYPSESNLLVCGEICHPPALFSVVSPAGVRFPVSEIF